MPPVKNIPGMSVLQRRALCTFALIAGVSGDFAATAKDARGNIGRFSGVVSI
jgi:hypothetical protein